MSFYHRDRGLKCLKETPSGQLIETDRHARLFCSKQLLNDVTFIRFIDKIAIHISYTEKFTE